ncbi:MAG: S49 family peptidase [Candidatus Eisenbacteria sp.]|nr:S49 family peptidase [Candidatus Eisenbacteria bacterium]
MKSFLKMFVAVLLVQILLIALVVGIIAGKIKDDVEVPRGAALVQVLDGNIPEAPAGGGLPIPGSRCGTSHTAILENLEKARHDERIKAVVLNIGFPSIGWAKRNELRERITQLRDAGKPVWAFTEYLSGSALYLGSACDSLFLLPSGYVSLHGMAAGRPFAKQLLDEIGVEENLHRIEHYKAAAEMIQRESMSPTAKANIEWVLDAIYPEFVSTIERERGIDSGTLESAVFSEGTLVPQEALELGLVDRLLYWDEVQERLLDVPGIERDEDVEEEAWGPQPRTISGSDYAEVTRKDAGIKSKHTIAVVHATGMIAGEESGYSFPFGATMGSGTMTEAFRQAAENEDVAGIIYRIDSGGGESSTSWKIQRAALRAAEAKPMVVSMVDVAGSGGYLICYPLKPMIANPLSIVGSIGSISGKFNIHGLYDKLGITWDFVTRGPNALIESDYFDYTPEQWESFKERHWRDYYYWVDDIARFRNMTSAEVDSVGRGRVFTGEQALERGLIDEVGGFDLALRLVKEKAGIPADEEVEFIHYPQEKGFLEKLMSGNFGAAVQMVIDDILRPWRRPHQTWAVDWNRYH